MTPTIMQQQQQQSFHALFAQAREAVFALERRVAELKSELTRKDCEITRLRGTPPQAFPSVSASSTPVASRGIFTLQDVKSFLASPTCQALISFLEQLCQQTDFNSKQSFAATSTDAFLDRARALLETTELEAVDPQRFGNKAFRTWHAKLCNELADNSNPEFAALFSRSFGDATRIDFGTGHEVAFLMLVHMECALTTSNAAAEYRAHLVQVTLPRYFELVRALRKKFRLEPAGSHGVWSLDDYHFLPFVLGSAQLAMDKNALPPREFLADALRQGETLEAQDFFSQALLDIFLSKRAAHFPEHSPLLYSLLRQEGADWKQLHLGLVRMWMGEVLGKFPVAQHFCFGPSHPITWTPHGKEEEETVAAAAGGPTLASRDATSKYFTFQRKQSSEPQLNLADFAFSRLGPDTVQLGAWRIHANAEPRIGGQDELDALGFDFPLPEMLFTRNVLELKHTTSGVTFTCSAQHALRGCLDVTNRKLLKVPMANLWIEKRDAEGRPIKTWREDYDWTFTSMDLIACTGGTVMRPSALRRIDYERLKQQHEPILFYKEIEFFEDDLFDLGLSKFTVKLRVMQTLFFALARLFVRVDGSYYRIVDCRLYHQFGTKFVLMERSTREGAVEDLPGLQGLDFAQMNDSNYIAQVLPLLGPVETMEISL